MITVIPLGSTPPVGGGVGAAVTDTVVVPVFVSLKAEIVTVPVATPRTSPVVETLPTAGLLELQVTTRPVSGFLFASKVAADSCTVAPTWTLGFVGVIDTEATGTVIGLTVTAVDPVLPSLEAVTVTLPAATAVTSPPVETVATEGLPELQVTSRPLNTLLLASRVTAVSGAVLPTWSVAVAGDTDTVATGTGAAGLTVIAADPVCPSLEAVTDVVPATSALTRPEPETVAIVGSAETQVTVRPVSTLLLPSRVTADNCCDPPICRLVDGGVTETDATGIGGGAVTLKLEEPVFPSLDAVISAVPAPTAVRSPVERTVATLVLELVQVSVRPEIGLPAESCNVADATAFWPIRTADGLIATTTTATGTGGGAITDILAAPATPSLTALTTAVPGETAETTPESVTLAMDALEVDQVIGRSGSATPFASLGVAMARAVCPAMMDCGTETETEATAAGVFVGSTTEVPYDEQPATAKKRPATVSMKVRMECALPL